MSPIIGNTTAKEHFLSAVGSNRLAGCYILEGADGTGKLTLARYVAAALCCTSPGRDHSPCGVCHSCKNIAIGNHIDVPELRPEEEGKRITVAQIRQMLPVTYVSATEGDWRVIIIDDGQQMNKEAQNALLKSIEEVREHTLFLILTNDKTKLLPTVRSRAVFLRTEPLSANEMDRVLKQECPDPKRRKEVILLSGGSIGKAREILSNETAFAKRELVIQYFRAVMEGSSFTRLSLILPPSGTTRSDLSVVLPMIKSALRDLILLNVFPETKLSFFTDRSFACDLSSIVSPSKAQGMTELCDALLVALDTNINLCSALSSLHLYAQKLTNEDTM